MNVMKLDTGLYKRFHQEQKLLGEPDTYPAAYAPFSNLTMSLLLWKMTFTGLSSRINTLQTMTVQHSGPVLTKQLQAGPHPSALLLHVTHQVCQVLPWTIPYHT